MSREQAIARIKAMQKYPLMWAITVEGFLLQVALLLEICGISRKQLQIWMTMLDKDHVWTDDLNSEHSDAICDSALKLV